MSDWVGSTLLGRFRFEAVLAHSSDHTLFQARDLEREMTVMLDLLPQAVPGEHQALNRLEARFPTLLELQHPNLLDVYGLYPQERGVFVAQRYVEGAPLAKLLQVAEKSMPLMDALAVLRALAGALEALHAHSLAHGKLRPDLVWISQQGRLYLMGLDGLAGDRGEADRDFLAPEQLRGQAATPAADVYALGALLFLMLSGRRPFSDWEPDEEDERPDPRQQPPDVRRYDWRLPPAVSAAIQRALAPEAKARFTTPWELFLAVCAGFHFEPENVPEKLDVLSGPAFDVFFPPAIAPMAADPAESQTQGAAALNALEPDDLEQTAAPAEPESEVSELEPLVTEGPVAREDAGLGAAQDEAEPAAAQPDAAAGENEFAAEEIFEAIPSASLHMTDPSQPEPEQNETGDEAVEPEPEMDVQSEPAEAKTEPPAAGPEAHEAAPPEAESDAGLTLVEPLLSVTAIIPPFLPAAQPPTHSQTEPQSSEPETEAHAPGAEAQPPAAEPVPPFIGSGKSEPETEASPADHPPAAPAGESQPTEVFDADTVETSETSTDKPLGVFDLREQTPAAGPPEPSAPEADREQSEPHPAEPASPAAGSETMHAQPGTQPSPSPHDERDAEPTALTPDPDWSASRPARADDFQPVRVPRVPRQPSYQATPAASPPPPAGAGRRPARRARPGPRREWGVALFAGLLVVMLAGCLLLYVGLQWRQGDRLAQAQQDAIAAEATRQYATAVAAPLLTSSPAASESTPQTGTGLPAVQPSPSATVGIGAAPATNAPTPDEIAAPTTTPTPAVSGGAARPALEAGDITTNPQDGAELAYVPAGEFIMGSEPSVDPYFYGAEFPQHLVYVDGYWIYRTEVTNAMYAQCEQAGVCPPPAETRSATHRSYYGNPDFADYPVVFVSWENAKTYCEWAGGRLPTEAEWEKAARGTDARLFPWGNEDPNQNLLNYSYNDTLPVGSFPAGDSPYGVHDMSGNVHEWVFDFFQSDYYPQSPYENPQGPATGERHTYRGGSFGNEASALRSVMRGSRPPDYASTDIGFRCVVDVGAGLEQAP